MSFAATLTPLSFHLLPIALLLRGACLLALLVSFLMFFRPLLSGVMRALLLLLRARGARAERAAHGGSALGSGV